MTIKHLSEELERTRRLLPLFCICALALTLINIVPPAFAEPKVSISPSIVTGEPGESFTVEVRISAAIDVFGWGLRLSWNASVLNATAVAEGTFLKGLEGADTYFVNSTYQTADYERVSLGCTRLGRVVGVSGIGVLANVTFIAERKGETTLDLSATELYDSTTAPIRHTAIDGFFTNLIALPRPIFTFTPTIAKVNETILFDAGGSYDPDGSIESYFWDFGDGTNASEIIPIAYHDYDEGGMYHVTLTVTDNEGWNNSLALGVRVRFIHDLAVSSVSVSPTNVAAGETVVITVEVSNEGSETENGISVEVYYVDISVGLVTEITPAQTVSTLVSEQRTTLTFNWNTGDVAEGDYRIKAVATPVEGETSTLDNSKFSTATITVSHSAPFPWLYVGAGVAGVAVIAVVAILLLRRRGKSSSS